MKWQAILTYNLFALYAFFLPLQAIPGVPKIKDDYNPSTWMLEVTSVSMETKLGVDFAHLYRESSNYK
jgi:hypothetical protein